MEQEHRGDNEVAGFVIAIAFHAAIAGAVVGSLWAFALSATIINGLVWGACITVVVFVGLGLIGLVGRGLRMKEVVFVIGSIMTMASVVAGVVALAVWGYRAIF